MKAIMILDDSAERAALMNEALASEVPDVSPKFLGTAPEAIRWLEENLAELALISLDHDLDTTETLAASVDPGNGRDIADWLGSQPRRCPVILHSSNAPATSGMKFALEDAGWTVHRVVPYETNRWIREAWIARVKTILQPTAGAR